MKIVSPETFLDLPPGTVFAYGTKFEFSRLLIKAESIHDKKFWGFWAFDPCSIEPDNFFGEPSPTSQELEESGASFPMELIADKYMVYDGEYFDCFLIFEPADLDRLRAIMGNGNWE